VLTSFVGASAAPSQTPAANPQTTPMPCVDLIAEDGLARAAEFIRVQEIPFAHTIQARPSFREDYESTGSMQSNEHGETETENYHRDEEMTVGEDGSSFVGSFHSAFSRDRLLRSVS
jgi:hypothetical protein